MLGDKNKVQFDEDSDTEDGNFTFLVNKGSFPIGDKTWHRMWRYAASICPEAKRDIELIRNSEIDHDVPVSAVPVLSAHLPVIHSLHLVQNYIISLHYNHTGTQLFEIKKSRPLAGLMDKAKEMIKESLPIKCLEAVILSIHFTNCLPSIDRFPIGFKTTFNGHPYYHVVLGVVYNGLYGALGISRRKELMDKPIKYKSLFDLIEDYNKAYSSYGHQLKKVRVGGMVPHDTCSQEKIQWGILSINYARAGPLERRQKFDRFCREIKSHIIYYKPCSLKRETSTTHPFSEHTTDAKLLHPITSQGRLAKSRKPPSNNATYHVKV